MERIYCFANAISRIIETEYRRTDNTVPVEIRCCIQNMQTTEAIEGVRTNGFKSTQRLIEIEWPVRRFALDEYRAMVDRGFFEPHQNVELMDGLITWLSDRTDLSREPARIMQTELPLRRLTIDEYQWLVAEGILEEDERVELLDGLIVDMSPTNARHANCLDKLADQLYWSIRRRARIRVQSPVELQAAYSQPEPDISVVVERKGEYNDRLPGADDILLAVEVSDSSLEKDQGSKLQLYAAARVSDYWIVNLIDDQIEVYRDPHQSVSGKHDYGTKRTYAIDDKVELLAFPDCQIRVRDVLSTEA